MSMSGGGGGDGGISNEDCLRICAKGELDTLRDVLRNLDRTEIESIRDRHNARLVYTESSI